MRIRVSVSGTCFTQTTIFMLRSPSPVPGCTLRQVGGNTQMNDHSFACGRKGRERPWRGPDSLEEALEEKGPVRSPETEGVREGVGHPRRAGLVGDEVEVTLGIGVLLVDGGGQDLVAEAESNDPRFQPPRRPQKVAGHGLG